MDSQQADAQARSLMATDIDRQKEVQARLVVAERFNRLSASVALMGICAGGIVGYFGGFAVVRSALAGGLAAYFVCRVLFWVLGMRAVAIGRS